MFKSMAEVAAESDELGGIVCLTLGDLRDAVGAGKLGRWVLERISEELDAEGLGYFPPAVLRANDEPRQHQEIRIYRKGPNVVARVIDAVLNPTQKGDEVLRSLGGDDAREVLAEVRKLIGVVD